MSDNERERMVLDSGDVGRLDARELAGAFAQPEEPAPVKPKTRVPSNTLFELYRRAHGEDAEAWKKTGEVYSIDGDCGTGPEQKLSLKDFLSLRTIEDGWEYKAEPVMLEE